MVTGIELDIETLKAFFRESLCHLGSEVDHGNTLATFERLCRRAVSAERHIKLLEKKVQSVINTDRTGLAATLNHVKAIVNGYSWLKDPGHWGSYDFEQQTEETLRREAGDMIDSVKRAIARGLRASGLRADEAQAFKLVPPTEDP